MSLQAVLVVCPYCGEEIEIDVEWLGQVQSYIEDCSVCCRPIQFNVSAGIEGEAEVLASRSE